MPNSRPLFAYLKGPRFAAILLLLGSTGAQASPEAADSLSNVVDTHLADREGMLQKQRVAALDLVRQQAWMAYRLGRRRELGFFADTSLRPEAARASAMAVFVLNRSVHEAAKIDDELQRVKRERASYAARDAQGEPGASGPATTSKPSLVWPAKGPVISAPGLRPDPVTGVVYRDTGVQILARVDAAVVSPGTGQVRRVTNVPTGGYAVVIAHADGMVSVLSGLRVVDVSEGESVKAGSQVGLVGRTLDGAPVLRMAVWKSGQPVDPRAIRIW
jgi:murein DD-endopeptidase MepM/ murein hydrolase activator NlpD